jgi:hypothetical protein
MTADLGHLGPGRAALPILVVNRDVYRGVKLPERIRRALSECKITRRSTGQELPGITVSIGVGQFQFGESMEDLIERCDRAQVPATGIAIDAIRQNVSRDDVIFVDFQTSFLLRFYLCPEVGPADSPASEFRTYSCGGYRVISTNSETNVLTANLFLRRWNEMADAYGLKTGQSVWIFQAGWDIGLARELQERVPEFRDLKADSFGRNISLFKLKVGQETATGP